MVWFAPILFTFAATACSLAGLFFVRRWTYYAVLAKHNDVGTAVFGTLGTLFTVLLAFVVVIAWESMGAVAEKTDQEAGILGELIRDAGLFPDPVRTELQNELSEYAHAVVDDEWPAMGRGGSSDRVWNALNGIFKSFSRIEPSTPREINIHAEMLQRINELADHRRARLLSADSGLPSLMWAVLVCSAIITIAFSYFLGVERARPHALMTAALTVMISFTFYLILDFAHPFVGLVRVEPDAFRLVLQKIGRVDYSGGAGSGNGRR